MTPQQLTEEYIFAHDLRDQLPLQRLLRCSQRSIRITSQLLRDGGLVCFHDDLAQDPGVLVLPCEQVDQLSPQLWKTTEPVECSAR